MATHCPITPNTVDRFTVSLSAVDTLSDGTKFAFDFIMQGRDLFDFQGFSNVYSRMVRCEDFARYHVLVDW